MASTMPASAPSCPNTATTPASTAAHAPMRRNPTIVASMTGGRVSTAPNRRFDRGMRTRPSSGEEMNQMPPPIIMAAASRMPHTVPIWVDTNVVTTGPKTQMISCADASSEKSGVSWREFTIFG